MEAHVSQSEVLAVLGEVPLTQKELHALTHIDPSRLSHNLNCLLRDGRIRKVRLLDRPYQPNGYMRLPGIEVRQVVRWPNF